MSRCHVGWQPGKPAAEETEEVTDRIIVMRDAVASIVMFLCFVEDQILDDVDDELTSTISTCLS